MRIEHLALRIQGFNDQSVKIEMFSFPIFLLLPCHSEGLMWVFNPCKSIHRGDLAQILYLRRKHCLWRDLFPSQSSPFSCQNEGPFHGVMERECHV